MIAVIQRVSKARVIVDNSEISSIKHGYLILLGIMNDDSPADTDKLIQKIIHLRIMADENGHMNKSILETKGEVIVVSQFTLCADTSKGRRPSFIKAMTPEEAEKIYLDFTEKLRSEIRTVLTGKFGAEMSVELTNDGPVTITLDSKSLL
jgi:D-tyrosyl-tRNA(Tyr) deacylase